MSEKVDHKQKSFDAYTSLVRDTVEGKSGEEILKFTRLLKVYGYHTRLDALQEVAANTAHSYNFEAASLGKAEGMNPTEGSGEWYSECRKNAVETGTLEAFLICVERVSTLHKEQGGGDPTTVQWLRPMCHDAPDQLEFQTAKLYGCIALHGDNWSVNT